MAKSRIQISRSNVPLNRPAAGTRDPGELYVNWADRQFGSMDATKAPIDLVAVRYFATTASYLVDDVVLQNGFIYRALVPNGPGPFTPANWQIMGAMIEAPEDGSSYVRKDGDWVKLLDVDGAASLLDADLLDGQHGNYYLAQANATGTVTAAQFDDVSHGNRAGGSLHPAVTTSVNGFMTAADKVKLDSYAPATGYAPINSPLFTGDPRAPTPLPTDNDTSIATTAYVKSQGFLTDAPADGLTYGRRNNLWSTVVGGALVGDVAPTGPLLPGQLWWESDVGLLYIYYDDGSSRQWVSTNTGAPGPAGPQGPVGPAGPSGGAGTGSEAVSYIGPNPPAAPAVGQLWWESDSGQMFIYYQDINSIQWVPVSTGVTGSTAVMEAQIAALEARLAALEAR